MATTTSQSKGKLTPKPRPRSAARGEVLTQAEAAELLKVSEAVVVAEAAAGRLPGRRLGDEWRFGRSAILEWLSNPPGPHSDAELEQGRVRKSLPSASGVNDAFLSAIGMFADDPTLEPMVEEIYRRRKEE